MVFEVLFIYKSFWDSSGEDKNRIIEQLASQDSGLYTGKGAVNWLHLCTGKSGPCAKYSMIANRPNSWHATQSPQL